MRDQWTAERVNLLKQLWASGESARAIAAELGGLSRSAVLGKIYRLRRRAADPAAAAPIQQPRQGNTGGKHLLELTNACCRFPIGRRGKSEILFCGVPEADLARGMPYCAHHARRACLAQVVKDLKQAAFYDLNPTGKGHWTNALFGEHRDPMSRLPLDDPENYERMFLNPADNAANLAEDYLKSLARLPERQRKRFYEGVYIDELDGALFSYEMIARARVTEDALPKSLRVVVAVDPSGAAGRDDERADEIGIVVAGRGDDGHADVGADRSLRGAAAAGGAAPTATPTCSLTVRCATRRRRGAAPWWRRITSTAPT